MDKVILHRLGKHKSNHDIEASCGVMDICEDGTVKYRIMIDAGSVIRNLIDGSTVVEGPDLSLLHDGVLIDAILITHAHLDHCGYLPAIMPYLRHGAKTYMTRPSSMMVRYNLSEELMPRTVPGPIKAYGPDQIREAMWSIEIMPHVGRYRLFPDIDVWAHPAGHISGACSFTIRVKGKKFHYAGDRCDHSQPSVLKPPPMPQIWTPDVIAGSDCTYGLPSRINPTWEEEMDRLADLCEQAFRQRRRMLIYTFAQHRAGVIAHELQTRGIVRSQNRVYMDGSAKDFARMIDGNHGWCAEDSGFDIDKVDMLLAKNSRHAVHDAKYSSYVVIAPPGMGGPGGSGTWWRRRLIMDPKAIIAYTGFLAPGTDGCKMVEAAKARARGNPVPQLEFLEVNHLGAWREKRYPFRCQVEQFRLGSHNNREMTIQWFRDIGAKTAVLCHGSIQALSSVERELKDSGIQLIRGDKTPSVTIDL